MKSNGIFTLRNKTSIIRASTVLNAGSAVYVGSESGAYDTVLIVDGLLISKAIFIGSGDTANVNSLLLYGELIANTIRIGMEGNCGNMLMLGEHSKLSLSDNGNIDIAWHNAIGFEGDELGYADLIQRVDDAGGRLSACGKNAVTVENVAGCFTKDYDDGWTIFTANKESSDISIPRGFCRKTERAGKP